jgi:hypothetical protein
VSRLPLLPISFLLACMSVGGLVYQRTRPPAEPEAAVQLDRVAQAVATTSSAKSFTFTYTVSVSAAGQSFTMNGDGAYDAEHKLVAMKLHFPNAGAAQADADLVLDNSDGLVEYIHMPLLEGRLPGGKSWLKMDLEALSKKQGIDLSKLQQGANADPTKALEFLRRAASPTVVGQETVGGVETTHYEATIDLWRLAVIEPDAGRRASMKRAIELSGIRSYPVEVWIDGAGYVRRMRITIVQVVPEAPGGVATLTMTEELTSFDDRVSVAVPPDSSVIDVTELAGAAAS